MINANVKKQVANKAKKKLPITKRLQNLVIEFDYADFFNSLLWAIIVALIIRTMLFEPFKIPSGSMIPTLQIGDYIFATKYSYGYSKHSLPLSIPLFSDRILFQEPKRGDIIVFRGVRDPSIHYIKRLIGLPGDIIQLKKGILYINNQAIEKKPAGDFRSFGKYGESINYKMYIEKLADDVSYTILDANLNSHHDFPDDTPEYTVPLKMYFFMGDNRNNSTDSRYQKEMGFIPEENLVGKASFIFWSRDFNLYDLLTAFDTGRAFKLINNEN
jgi:signal peptidase I